MAASSAPAQTFTSLVSFGYSNGASPQYGSLIVGADENLYGTTSRGGAFGYGTVFQMTPAGVLTTLYSFCAQTNCTDGSEANSGLVLGSDGNFYGTTPDGGTSCTYFGCGTVFKMSPAGALTTIYNFCSLPNCADGSTPYAGLVQAANGNFYGTTFLGGANCTTGDGCGTVYEITPTGVLTTLHSFCAETNCADGATPDSPLVLGSNKTFYGTTYSGGAISSLCTAGCGTVFKMGFTGALTTLHSFKKTDGGFPIAGLVEASTHKLYGTTYSDGKYGVGTVFEMTLAGKLTTLQNFNGTDGQLPHSPLVQGTDGNLYGTTLEGGGSSCPVGCGTVYQITPTGTLTTLHSFDGTDGLYPEAGLVQASNGIFYGTTSNGGAAGYGTLFSLSVSLQ